MAVLFAGLLTVAAASGVDPEPTGSPIRVPAETVAAATEAGLDPIDVLGAQLTVGLPAREYLISIGALAPSTPIVPAWLERTADCIIWRESRGNPRAVNSRSGASGLGQFLRSTWATTPQGKAGASVFDAVANRAAVIWMLVVGRGHEFATLGGC